MAFHGISGVLLGISSYCRGIPVNIIGITVVSGTSHGVSRVYQEISATFQRVWFFMEFQKHSSGFQGFQRGLVGVPRGYRASQECFRGFRAVQKCHRGSQGVQKSQGRNKAFKRVQGISSGFLQLNGNSFETLLIFPVKP